MTAWKAEHSSACEPRFQAPVGVRPGSGRHAGQRSISPSGPVEIHRLRRNADVVDSVDLPSLQPHHRPRMPRGRDGKRARRGDLTEPRKEGGRSSGSVTIWPCSTLRRMPWFTVPAEGSKRRAARHRAAPGGAGSGWPSIRNRGERYQSYSTPSTTSSNRIVEGTREGTLAESLPPVSPCCQTYFLLSHLVGLPFRGDFSMEWVRITFRSPR
jgi:hypothetical protein